MKKTNSGAKTTRQTNGKKSSSKVSAKELTAVVNSVCETATAEVATAEVPTIGGLPSLGVGSAVSVPASSGVTACGCDPVLSAGAEGGLQPAKVRQSAASQVASSEIMECDPKLVDLRKKIVSVFAVPEWEGRAQLIESLDSLVLAGVMTEEQKAGAVAAADRKAGVSAPICSVPRVLAVARHYSKEVANVLGVSFDSIVNYYRKEGASAAVAFTPRLSFNAVRADSVLSDFVDSVSLPADASASAVVSAVFSVRHAIEFNRLVSRQNSNTKYDCKEGLRNSIRSAQRVKMTLDEVLAFVRNNWDAVRLSDSKERETLRKNNVNAWTRINELNDLILLAGGAACTDGLGGCDASEKHAAKVRKLIARRARFESVAATTAVLIAR